MKRLRDDDDDDYDYDDEDFHINNSQLKRSSGSSRGESYGQPQISLDGGGGGGDIVVDGGNVGASKGTQKLTTTDALTYIQQVKEMFEDHSKYDMFLALMKGFKAQTIETEGVIEKVKELFKGHNNLIFGFNAFLPKDYHITVIDEEETPPKRTAEFEETIKFVIKLKKRFQNDDQVYKSFLDILNMYRKGHKDVTELYQEVAILFGRHQDLVEEFIRFLPYTSASQVPSGQHSFQLDDRNFAMTATHQAPIDKKRRRGRPTTLVTDHDQSHEPIDSEKDKTIIKMQKDLKKHAEKDSKERRTHDRKDREPETDSNREFNMQRVHENRKSNPKIEDFRMNPLVTSCNDKKSRRSVYKEEFIFCENVKERLGSFDDYQAFLKFLHIYSSEIITRKELQGLVSDLLGKYPDLMDGFNEFLEHCENIDEFLAGFMNKKSLWSDGNGCNPVKKKVHKNEMEPKEKDKCKEKYMGKSIQELDLSDCQRCTPSYRLLPDDYPIPIASQRSELGTKVLNNRWVSVTSGSEDYSVKHIRRNTYEENLFRCEDDRFELDMLLESVRATAKRAEELLNRLNNNTVTPDSPIRIEDHFTVLDFRCIERLYGDHGLDVLEILKKNPCVALPVLLTRLKQKQEEWTQCRTDFNKVWAEIYRENHCKSLDHRSFYFKQQDSKNLSIKSLVTQIKEIKEKTHRVDDGSFSLMARNRYLIIPNLDYEYVDAGIHEDMYKLVKYSSKEVCSTKEQFNKIMKLWTSFLEPMLGVSSRSHGIEGTNDDVKSRQPGPGASAFATNDDILESNHEGKSDDNEDGNNSREPQLEDGELSETNNVIIGRHLEETEKEEGELSPNEEEEGEHDHKGESECEVKETPAVHFGGTNYISQPMTDSFLQTAKPLAKHVSSMLPKNEKKDSRVFYGDDTFYVLFRLHQILYERLLSAKLNSKAAETKLKTVNDGSPPDLYSRFMSVLYNLLEGSIDNAKFEDDCRSIIGNQSYVLLTLDKLICKIVKQLQTATTDETDDQLLQLHEYEKSRKQSHSADSVYYDNVSVMLKNENIYRLESSSAGARLSIQLMDDGSDKPNAVAISMHPNFNNYLHNNFLSIDSSKKEPAGVYLQRNKRKIAGMYDTSNAHKVMEGVTVLNRLEYKMSCRSSKVSYVWGTEDFFIRMKRGRRGYRRAKVKKV
ncbi:paired amphipathic helix protein Sin3-like 2 [Impatiens glandulifera]|uniref:paired amphipathic helix protein Sin3-like 2 n=1 Tax=Impatiens glandulifera TaxID=253017 RepID=UPI001FB157B4|nr:paired amphipathic helix protein Sin3-like 2 [Impatiens glandulifera]XP_047310773.1 paired amphipathic helix protein Sin3-like 2 [Impatiens glandulifera]